VKKELSKPPATELQSTGLTGAEERKGDSRVGGEEK